MRDEAASLLLAVQFLTRIPVRSDKLYTAARMANSVHYYPLVGVGVGGLCALVFGLFHAVYPQTIAVLLAVAAGLLITGAFHEDGLADTFDGLGGSPDRERALQIMKDSRVGTYGALALLLVLLLKIASLVHLPVASLFVALVAAHGLSRLSSVCVIASSRYVRDEGTGKPVSRGISGRGFMFACLTGIVCLLAAAMVIPVTAVLYALLGLVLGHVLMRCLFERSLGGYTGDTLGAVQQTSETGFYLGLLACPCI